MHIQSESWTKSVKVIIKSFSKEIKNQSRKSIFGFCSFVTKVFGESGYCWISQYPVGANVQSIPVIPYLNYAFNAIFMVFDDYVGSFVMFGYCMKFTYLRFAFYSAFYFTALELYVLILILYMVTKYFIVTYIYSVYVYAVHLYLTIFS